MDAFTLLGVLEGHTTKQEMAQKHRAVLVVSNIFQHKLSVVGGERIEDELGQILQILHVILAWKAVRAAVARVADSGLQLCNPGTNKIFLG